MKNNFIEPTKYTKYQFYQSILDTDNLDEIKKNKTDFDINEEHFPAFRGIDLPDNFLQIINDPFNIKLESKSSEETLICLAKGDIVTMKLLNRNIPIPKELSCQPILNADGQKINGIDIRGKSTYRNRKGEEKVGFTNGYLVFLDNKRYIDLIDDYISGRCILNIQNK